MAEKTYSIGDLDSGSSKTIWDTTINMSDINNWALANIPAYSTINSVILSFNCYKSASIRYGSCYITINGEPVYTNEGNVVIELRGGLDVSASIEKYIKSETSDAGYITNNIDIKIRTYNNDTAHMWYIKDLKIVFNYTLETVTATFRNYDNTILQTVTVNKGVVPTYTGLTPVRQSDSRYNYVFSGWSPNVDVIISNTEYTAQFSSVERKYKLTVSVNDTSMAYIEMNKNGVVVSGNSVEYSISDIASFRVCANKGYILSNVSVTNNTDSTTLTLTADQAYTEGYLNDSYTIFTWNDMTINESMLGMEVNIELEYIAGSKIYTLTVTANNNSLGDITLYKNDTVVNGNVLEGVFGDKLTIMSTANDNSFINSVSDGATLLDRNTLISSNLLDDICKQLNLSIEVKESYIGNEETLIINFTPGINMYFAGKKAIELYYEGNLFSGAYFEGNKL